MFSIFTGDKSGTSSKLGNSQNYAVDLQHSTPSKYICSPRYTTNQSVQDCISAYLQKIGIEALKQLLYTRNTQQPITYIYIVFTWEHWAAVDCTAASCLAENCSWLVTDSTLLLSEHPLDCVHLLMCELLHAWESLKNFWVVFGYLQTDPVLLHPSADAEDVYYCSRLFEYSS